MAESPSEKEIHEEGDTAVIETEAGSTRLRGNQKNLQAFKTIFQYDYELFFLLLLVHNAISISMEAAVRLQEIPVSRTQNLRKCPIQNRKISGEHGIEGNPQLVRK